jgi:predicted esterase YcpF (UPF0227 family)
MFSVKIFNDKKNRTSEFDKTISNIVSYIFEKLHYDNTRVVSDDSCIEIVSGKEETINSDQVVVELLIRKNILINNSDFKDRAELDRYLTKIRHFCDQAKEIEELQYIPINMRDG